MKKPYDFTKRKPPYYLVKKLKRLMRKAFELRLELGEKAPYCDANIYLVEAEGAIYQAILGNASRNEFHTRENPPDGYKFNKRGHLIRSKIKRP